MINTSDVRTSTDQILMLERGALDRWGAGDPGGFLQLYAPDISYFDPVTATRVDRHQAMVNYYRQWVGKIQIARYEMLNPHVVVDGDMALLTYNLVNYIRDANGVESVGSRWNSTTVYQRRGDTWKVIHSHWSFTKRRFPLHFDPSICRPIGEPPQWQCHSNRIPIHHHPQPIMRPIDYFTFNLIFIHDKSACVSCGECKAFRCSARRIMANIFPSVPGSSSVHSGRP